MPKRRKHEDKTIFIVLFVILVLILLLFLLFRNGEETSTEEERVTGDNICEDYPDFTGTPREGEVCEDNLDCKNHPPLGYVSGALECIEGKCRYNC